MLALVIASGAAGIGCGSASGAPPTLSYVAFGDSLAAWETATGYGYTKSFKDGLAADRHAAVHETNLGHHGDYSIDMLAAVRKPAAQAALRTADVVTWNIGANDFGYARSQFLEGTCGGPDNQDCLRIAVATFSANWDAIVSTLTSAPHKPTAVFRTMDIFYPGGAAGDPSFAVTNPYLEQMNAHIRSTAAFASVSDVRLLFNGPGGTGDPADSRPAAPDGFVLADGHPNPDGAEAIGVALRSIDTDRAAAERE